MKTQFVRTLAMAVLAAASMYAQPRMTVQIPFGFHVGATMLPSGEYTVDTHSFQGVVRLKATDPNSKASALILSNAVQTYATPDHGKLVFNRYGNEYFLSQVWNPGSNTGRELRKTRLEVETASIARRSVESTLARR